MKESTGAVSAIYVVIFFVIIMFGFIISTLSYYKSYKINNSLTAAIEDYGGFNSKSKDEIEKRLTSYGYTKGNVKCNDADGSLVGINDSGEVIFPATNDSKGYKGYCVYIVDGTPEPEEGKTKTDYEYYSYKVTTSMTLDFGLFNFNLPIKMSSLTSTMYSCYGGVLNCPNVE